MAITIVDEQQLSALVLGAAVLGSGGGGNPRYDYLIARQAIRKYGPVRLMQLAELTPADFVVPLCFMGAPLVCMEKIPSGIELKAILNKVESLYERKVTALVATEIGGGNAFVPYFIAGELGLPVLDADNIGRAFPELQMSASFLMADEVTLGVTMVADEQGNVVTIDTKDPRTVETIARAVTVAMGSVAAEMMHVMPTDVAQKVLVAGTVSQAIQIGECILSARRDQVDPIAALVNAMVGRELMRGMITDIDHSVQGGFLRGKVVIHGKQLGEVQYQNEYLLARVGGEVVATTPDIIMLLEEESGEPLTTDMLAFGLRVAVVVLPAPVIWTSAKGLALVGPRAFGFDTDYVPCGSQS